MAEPSTAADLLGPCAAIARRYDRERYLCALFAKPAARSAVMALLAFCVEIGKTREVVSEAMLGEIRLQWWRDAIAGIYDGSPRRHAVVDALADAITRHDLTRAVFDAAIDARAADLEDTPPPSRQALADYAAATSGGFHKLIAQVQGLRDPEALAAAERVGTAWALVGLVRAAPYLARVRRLVVPYQILEETGARVRDLLDARPTPETIAALRAVAGMAEAELAAVPRRLPPDAAPALLPAVLLRRHAGAIRHPDWQPFTGSGLRLPALAPLTFWLRGRFGRY